MPFETDLSGLTINFTVSENATAIPVSGTNVDFSEQNLEITVTAEDESTKVWTVTVIEAPEPDPSE